MMWYVVDGSKGKSRRERKIHGEVENSGEG